MAKDAANSVRYYLSVRIEHKADLASIRQWSNLKVGFDEDVVWVRDFDYAQIHSVEVKSLPFKSLFYERENKLFLLNSALPERHVPSVLWTPIDRALPVTVPDLYHNYFGLQEQVSVQLIQKEGEGMAVAMIAELTMLESYIDTAPVVRTEKIRWAILDSTKALLLGTPFLPLPGNTLWQRKDFLIPSGYDLDLYLMADLLQKELNPGRDQWVLWNADSSYSLLPKNSLQPLSRSSFRLTMANY